MANLLNNLEAINQALFQTMRKDKSIVIYGEDCGFEGGVFRVTSGLQKEFGKERVWNAPISEATIVGTAVGASTLGLKPVVEMQFQGFSYPAFQQIIANAARLRNRSRGRFHCPMVVRMPMGGKIKALEHHSEAIETMFAHIPGLKVVMASNPYDSKGLLIAAINDPDPVIFLEPKRIYRAFRQEIPDELYEVAIGKAKVLLEGKTVTVVTYGAQVHDSLEAIKNLKQSDPDISIELIDLRSLSPIDTTTIVNSVKKTGRLVVVHEAVKTLGIASEIIARVNEKAFLYLQAPLSRVTGYDITIPLAKGEHYHSVTSKKIVQAIKKSAYFVA